MSQIFDTVILGGGVSGLTAGYELARQGKKIVILEKSSFLGGLIRPLFINNYYIEGFYHHLFLKDNFFLNLLKELNIPVDWDYTSTAFCYGNNVYEFSQPIDLLRFSALSNIEKIKLVLFLIKILKVKDFSRYDNINACDWLIENLGQSIYEKFFKPLLWAKFNTDLDKISAAWVMGRLKMRSERSFKGERLGYIRGGYISFINAIEKKINESGSNILINNEVVKITKTDAGIFEIHTCNEDNGNVFFARSVISTIHPTYLSRLTIFPDEYVARMNKLKYQGAICILLGLENKLTDYYWINIMKENMNFGALIEHTNFRPLSDYGEHIIYLASYPSENSKLWDSSDSLVMDAFYNDLIKLFPAMCKKDKIKWFRVIRTRKAGLVYKTGIKALIPAHITPVTGLFVTGMFNCYPKRPINDLMLKADECVKDVMKYL